MITTLPGNRNLRSADIAFEPERWSLPRHVGEEISSQVVGETWEVASVQQCPPPTRGLAMLSQRNHSFWGCPVLTGLLMVVWAKIISLLLLRGLAQLLWSPMLSYHPPVLPVLLSSPCSWPAHAFLGYGHTSDGTGSWHKSRMERWGQGEPCHTGQPLPRQTLSPSKANPTADSSSHPSGGGES